MQLDTVISKQSSLFNDDWNDPCLGRRNGESVTKAQADSLTVLSDIVQRTLGKRGTFASFCRTTFVIVHQPTIL